MSQSVNPFRIFSRKCRPVEHHSLLDIWEVVGQMHFNWPDPTGMNKLAALFSKINVSVIIIPFIQRLRGYCSLLGKSEWS